MKKSKLSFFLCCLILLNTSVLSQTNKPIVEFLNQSITIQQGGRPIAWPDGDNNTSPGSNGVSLANWESLFKAKFEENFPFMVNQLDSDLVVASLEGESGGKANFLVEMYVFCIHDCEPCSGDEAFSEEYLAVYLSFIDNKTNQNLLLKKTEATFNISGAPDVNVSVDRAWSEFLRTFIKEDELKQSIKNLTYITDASLVFKPKDPSEELPMKADGKKKGELKVSQLLSEGAAYPTGENNTNPLTEFELSCKNGYLIDQNGEETKKVLFKGSEYVDARDNFKFDYVVYNCDDICDKYDDFTLKLKGQNGQSLIREIKVHQEEFACYGYTLSLEYIDVSPIYGTSVISASWECFQINFGMPEVRPDTLSFEALMSGIALNSNGEPLTTPYVIPLAVEQGQIHVSAPIRDPQPATYTFESDGGIYAEIAASFAIDFGEESLTNPPELILVKSATQTEEMCGEPIGQGVYLEWQFDIWATLPDLGYAQFFQLSSTACTGMMEKAGYIKATVPEAAIALMKQGKEFTFSNRNSLGASYTISGKPTN